MAKYSTGGSSGAGDGDTCELCGAESNSLREANVAGAQLRVCPSCAPHDDKAKTSGSSDGGGSEDAERDRDRKRKAVQNAAKASDVWQGDSSHWEEEGANYDDDQLPYLVKDYGQIVVEARQEAGLQREELADELGVSEADLLAVEQGRATQAGVGGSLVIAIEDRLDVDLSRD
jgi:ribosome-binding protein aMBF1 (putative translation factor)